jgi:hypothetical protein
MIANNYITHLDTRRSRQRLLWTWVCAAVAVILVLGSLSASGGTLCEEIKNDMNANVRLAQDFTERALKNKTNGAKFDLLMQLADRSLERASHWATIFDASCK